MRKVSEKFLSIVLAGQQKQLNMLSFENHDRDFMKNDIIADGTWIYGLSSMRSLILYENENLTLTTHL